MKVVATLTNAGLLNDIIVETDGAKKTITIPAKPSGQGSSVNGGELLFLSLATCFCNDLYREAVQRNIIIHWMEVKVTGHFGLPGEPASNISYEVQLKADHSESEIRALIQQVDEIAEIHKTLRKGQPVSLIWA